MCQEAEQISGWPLGSEPSLFWQPWIGHWTHLAPGDMGGLHVHQYVGIHKWVTKQVR